MDETTKKKTGFAAMSREQVQEIARRGAKEAHRLGVCHQFTREEARIAGSKGGRAVAARKRAKGAP